MIAMVYDLLTYLPPFPIGDQQLKYCNTIVKSKHIMEFSY